AAPGTPAWIGPSAIVSRAVRLIERGALDEASVDELAGRVGVGGRQLRRLFTEHLGTSPLLVARSRRAHFARSLLDATTWPMTQVAQEAGFRSLRRFNEVMLAVFQRTPSELRRRGGADGPAITLRLAYRPPYDWPALIAACHPGAGSRRRQRLPADRRERADRSTTRWRKRAGAYADAVPPRAR
ncbi:MAG: helix-turn-helix transcriptional regulator, partial [Chloroflexi bacterium]